jgi:hypothetical protein
MSLVKKQKKVITEKTSISVNEFKSWILGVQDMQGADWCPSSDQWKKVLMKIAILQEVVYSNNTPIQHNYQPQYQSTFDQYDQQHSTNTTGTAINNTPVPLYKAIDLNKTPDIIVGEYKSAFM